MPAPALNNGRPIASPFDAEESGKPSLASPFDALDVVPASAGAAPTAEAGGAAAAAPEPAALALAVAAPAPAEAPPELEPEKPRRPDVHSDRAKYFVITSNTKDNVVLSVRHSLWATQRKNEQRLDEAFRTSPAVILVFSVNHSQAFQGYALMRSPVGKPQSRGTDPFRGFGRLFDLEWLSLHDLPYREVQHLRNPINFDRPVQTSRDGQELSNDVGRRLCEIIDRHIDEPTPSPGRQAPAKPDVPAAAPPAKRQRTEETPRRKAPDPLTSSMDEQLQYFLSLDYDEYCEWFERCGAKSPGPLSPPGVAAPPPSILELARSGCAAPQGLPAPAPHHGGAPPMFFGMPPHGMLHPPPPQHHVLGQPWTPPPIHMGHMMPY